MEYNPQLAAIAVNFSELLGEAEIEDEELFYKMLMKALEKSGYGGYTVEEVNQNIEYYLTNTTDVDIYSLLEYRMQMPTVKKSELY
jgi:ActR/RegA family two-component response regulator